MVDTTYQNVNVAPLRATISWAAVWAGVFAFIAIWSVFGLLGMAIFASAANPSAQQPVTGMNVGMGIWAIILTAIAMWVAGRVTGHLAGIGNSSRRPDTWLGHVWAFSGRSSDHYHSRRD